MDVGLIALVALGLVSGLLIGCIGIGGVILVPALVFVGGIPIQRAIPAALIAYIVAGLVATAIFARNGTIRWGMTTWLCAAAAPAAFAGAWAVTRADPRVLEIAIGLLTLIAGLDALRGRGRKRAEAAERTGGSAAVSPPLLLAIGAVTGFASAVSGTGGPLVLMPILTAMNLPVLTAIGLSQAIQVPIAVVGTLGNYLYGELDWRLGLVLAATLMLGSWQGAHLAHVLPRDLLRCIVSMMLVLVGGFILVGVVRHAMG